MLSRKARIVLGTTIAALVLAACGGGGLSKEEYIAQADRLCARADARTEDLGPPKTAAQLEEFASKAQTITSELVDDLRELEPPEDDQPTIDRLIATIEKAIEYLPGIAEAAREQDFKRVAALGEDLQTAASEANDIAQEYGMKTCGRVNPSEGSAPSP